MPICLEVALVLGLILVNGCWRPARSPSSWRAGGGCAARPSEVAAARERRWTSPGSPPTSSRPSSGITLIGIVVGAVGGASFSGPFGNILAGVPGLAPYAHNLACLNARRIDRVLVSHRQETVADTDGT